VDDDITLADAYAVETPDDNRRLYARWADTYDTQFAGTHAYELPDAVAAVYCDAGGATDGVLDVGCGTGLVGVALARRGVTGITGIDISPEMLARAAEKTTGDGAAVYAAVAEADLTDRIEVDDDTFAGAVSAGTFTHGHVGPGALDEVLRVCRPGAVLALSVNAELFDHEAGFGDWMAAAVEDGRITAARTERVPVYSGDALGAVGEHGVATDNAYGMVLVFTKR
jgi:predicted TPR repeat methyltransferase